MSEVQYGLMGWCSTNHHDRCRAEYQTTAGVTRRCDCPCHQEVFLRAP